MRVYQRIMPKVSVNILTKNRAQLLEKALVSVLNQSFADYEVVVVNDGSTDSTESVLSNFKAAILNFQIINHKSSSGITLSRQEALLRSRGEYVAILDDDDEWLDRDKLKKQVEFLDKHQEVVLAGGGIEINQKSKTCLAESRRVKNQKFRAETDKQIRKIMLFRNNFFTSTVMFRREAAVKAGGFIFDGADLAEDYDLWLRLGEIGQMYNFQEPFTAYRLPSYNKGKFRQFLQKQMRIIKNHPRGYPFYFIASTIIRIRLLF